MTHIERRGYKNVVKHDKETPEIFLRLVLPEKARNPGGSGL